MTNIDHLMNKPYKVRSIGGALVVTIPAHILRLVPLKAGDSVTFNTIGKTEAIVISPVKGKRK